MPMLLGPLLILAGLLVIGLIEIPLPGGLTRASFTARLARFSIAGEFALGFVFALTFCPVSAALFFGSLIPLAIAQSPGVILPGIYGTGNSCRGHMTEGIFRHAAGDRFEVFSAGSKPAGYVHPKAIAALAELGIDISQHTSKHMNNFFSQDIHTADKGMNIARPLCISVCQDGSITVTGMVRPTVLLASLSKSDDLEVIAEQMEKNTIAIIKAAKCMV